MTWDQFCKDMKKAADKAADKINQTADLAALQVKLGIAEHKLNDAYATLGRVAFQHFSQKDNNADAVAAACEAVKKAQKVCNKLKADIANAERQAAQAKE